MEKLPKFEKRGKEEIEILYSLKESFVHLCTEMKTEIESGHYDTLISDDTGGRIPTLVFRSILKLVNPDHKFNTLFVAAGKNYKPDNLEQKQALKDYLRSGVRAEEGKKVLVVTQHIHSGDTLQNLTDSLRDLDNVDEIHIATIDSVEAEENLRHKVGYDKLFVGGIWNSKQISFTENNNILSGISKRKNYDPRPMRLDKAIAEGDIKRTDFLSEEEWEELLGYEENDDIQERQNKIKLGFEKAVPEMESISLDKNEKIAIQDNVNRTRKIIKQIATEVFEKVWIN